MQIAPYISDRKKKRKRVRAYLFTAVSLLILYAIFFSGQWLIFHSPVFRVDGVVVQGNGSIASSSIVSLAEASALPTHSILRGALTFGNMLLWPAAIPKSELELIPQLASASIAKDYFSHTITITVTERRSAKRGNRAHCDIRRCHIIRRRIVILNREFERTRSRRERQRAVLLVRQHRHDL